MILCDKYIVWCFCLLEAPHIIKNRFGKNGPIIDLTLRELASVAHLTVRGLRRGFPRVGFTWSAT